jgi:hypothetical protein
MGITIKHEKVIGQANKVLAFKNHYVRHLPYLRKALNIWLTALSRFLQAAAEVISSDVFLLLKGQCGFCDYLCTTILGSSG